MNFFRKQAWVDQPMLMLICLGMVILPVSNSVGQVPLYAASLMWLVLLIQKKTKVQAGTWIFIGGWMLLILVSLTYAVHPELGIKKLSRFFIFPLIAAVPTACLSGKRMGESALSLCKSITLGVTLLGVYDLFQFPLEMRAGVAFQDVGDMTSPQFYLVGLVLWLGLISLGREKVGKVWWFCLPLLMSGLLLHQKRGVWLATMVTVGLWTLWSRKWKTLVVLLVMAGISLCIPQVQHRLGELREVIQPTHGGRMVLWREVAPRIFDTYPWGMGYNGSRYEDFREVLPTKIHMEVGLRHLHNNFLQIRLELGWPGVIWWCIWMGFIFWKAFASAATQHTLLKGAVAFAFLGLILNGLVEYNFGDSEILKLYLVLFGLIDVFHFQMKSETDENSTQISNRI